MGKGRTVGDQQRIAYCTIASRSLSVEFLIPFHAFLSVTLWYCIYSNAHFVKLFSHHLVGHDSSFFNPPPLRYKGVLNTVGARTRSSAVDDKPRDAFVQDANAMAWIYPLKHVNPAHVLPC